MAGSGICGAAKRTVELDKRRSMMNKGTPKGLSVHCRH